MCSANSLVGLAQLSGKLANETLWQRKQKAAAWKRWRFHSKCVSFCFATPFESQKVFCWTGWSQMILVFCLCSCVCPLGGGAAGLVVAGDGDGQLGLVAISGGFKVAVPRDRRWIVTSPAEWVPGLRPYVFPCFFQLCLICVFSLLSRMLRSSGKSFWVLVFRYSAAEPIPREKLVFWSFSEHCFSSIWRLFSQIKGLFLSPCLVSAFGS